MGQWITRTWIPQDGFGISRLARRGGDYRAYLPDGLIDRAVVLPEKLSIAVSRVENRIRELSSLEAGSSLEGISRFLLRLEAISSSRIEGIAPRPDKIAIASVVAA